MGTNSKTHKDKPYTKRDNNIQYVTLPYDFMPFPKQFYYPYAMDSLPSHARQRDLSGYIEYTIRPESDMAIELRETPEKKYYISGSNIRGKIRSNLEILSQSYPRFINRTPMLYRDITNSLGLSENYRTRLDIANETNGLEKSIQVGFLRKDDDGYYVIPAKKITNDKFFLSIKEHRLRDMGVIGDKVSSLFGNDDNDNNYIANMFAKINMIQKEIDKITKKIELLKADLSVHLTKNMKKQISDIFFMDDYSFLKSINRNKLNAEKNKMQNVSRTEAINNYILNIKENLLSSLKVLAKNDSNEMNEYFECLAKRWMLKAQIHATYLYMQSNKKFSPYQLLVFFNQSANGGIENIEFSPTESSKNKGYLYNSTNASSKRSHYLVGEPDGYHSGFKVDDTAIISYEENLKKMKSTDDNKEIKDFYNIFNKENFDRLIKANPVGIIVFFKPDNNKVIKMGRTPYFKIPYKNSITDLLPLKSNNRLDYADSLFGYVADKLDQDNPLEKTAYKSRIRFSPIDASEKSIEDYNDEKFMLHTPSATSNAMYLKQTHNSKKIITYEGGISYNGKEIKPEPNGYKYYHILDTEQESAKEPKKLISERKVLRVNNQELSGKVYFKNLTQQELGLLLLSLDIREFLKTNTYSNKYIQNNDCIIEGLFEQIGGAKPYGYGKVQIDIVDIKLEKTDSSFESLMEATYNSISEEHKYNKYDLIDAFIAEMTKHDRKYLDYLKAYIDSKIYNSHDEHKLEDGSYKHPLRITWNYFSQKDEKGKAKQVGYPKTWRLKLKKNNYNPS
ncbi:hypothetical protein [Desulfuribacillus alkaliarsenatis]|uniref:CRISPR-associated RAMP family protein n=1 Tax=Desulfuribacillus alkaliarsenatis TaxID=766136 RepID=A0A1E5G2E3_9FIRM|nr:hypothetical protein [Desulfuribacillus alkaliarsenatis]OEF97145.1 hypothetical protein BHF68_05990 [Desulfuribacillus alkaliarsenatis]